METKSAPAPYTWRRAYVSVPLPFAAERALRKLAAQELRAPRMQAAALVIDGLRRAGFDPDVPDPSEPAA